MAFDQRNVVSYQNFIRGIEKIMQKNYKIVEYAHMIGKPTSEFTNLDMINFFNWDGESIQKKKVMSFSKTNNGKIKVIVRVK